MGRRWIFLTFSLLVEIEGHFTKEFVSYIYETEDPWFLKSTVMNMNIILDFYSYILTETFAQNTEKLKQKDWHQGVMKRLVIV
jgi:hypothetical protein